MTGFMLVMALALESRHPSVVAGRLSAVLQQMADSRRVSTGSQCAPQLKDIPVALSLTTHVDGERILAHLLSANWSGNQNVRLLSRTRQLTSRLESEQSNLLQKQLEPPLSEWRRAIAEARTNPEKYGAALQAQIEEYIRGSGRQGAKPKMPLDLLRSACLLDAGAERLAKLKYFDFLYLSDRNDGIHAIFGPEATALRQGFQRILDEPTVREALRAAYQVTTDRRLDQLDLKGSRTVVWITRQPRGLASFAWLYSRDGVLLDFAAGLDSLGTPSTHVSPLSKEVGEIFVNPSDLTKLLAGRIAGHQVQDSTKAVQNILLAAGSRSIADPFAMDLCAALATAYPGKSIAIQFDEGWVGKSASLMANGKERLSIIFDVSGSGRGITLEEKEDCVYIRPALVLDSEAVTSDPSSNQRDMKAAFSPGGESIEDLCELADGQTWAAFQTGLSNTYRFLAKSEGGKCIDDSALDYSLLRILSRLRPLPSSEEASKSRPVVSSEISKIARHAIASPFMGPSKATPKVAAITQRASIYTDGEILLMPWAVRRSSNRSYAFVGKGGAPISSFTRNSLIDSLAHQYVAYFSKSEELLADLRVLTGRSSYMTLGVNVGAEAAWEGSFGERITWDAKPVRIGDLPEGKDLIREAVARAAPPQLPIVDR